MNINRDGSILIHRFTLSEGDLPGWRKFADTIFGPDEGILLRRTIWDNQKKSDESLLVDIFEAPCEPEAIDFARKLVERDSGARHEDFDANVLASTAYLVSEDFSVTVVGNIVISVKRFGRIRTDTKRWALVVRELALLSQSGL